MARNARVARQHYRQHKHTQHVLKLFMVARQQHANMVQSYIAEAYDLDANFFVNFSLTNLLADFDLYVGLSNL